MFAWLQARLRGPPVAPPLPQRWEACVDKNRDDGNDFVETCVAQTRTLKECLDQHPEYYGPLLARLFRMQVTELRLGASCAAA
jgi:GCK domain